MQKQRKFSVFSKKMWKKTLLQASLRVFAWTGIFLEFYNIFFEHKVLLGANVPGVDAV